MIERLPKRYSETQGRDEHIHSPTPASLFPRLEDGGIEAMAEQAKSNEGLARLLTSIALWHAYTCLADGVPTVTNPKPVLRVPRIIGEVLSMDSFEADEWDDVLRVTIVANVLICQPPSCYIEEASDARVGWERSKITAKIEQVRLYEGDGWRYSASIEYDDMLPPNTFEVMQSDVSL